MARTRKTQPEEESIYDAFLAPPETPRVEAADGAGESADPIDSPPDEAEPRARPQDAREASNGSAPEASGAGGATRRRGKRNDPEYMQASAYLPKQLRRRIDRFLLGDPAERDYSQLVAELLEQFLSEQKDDA